VREPLTILTQDQTPTLGPRHPIGLVLDNLRSAFNVGNIFRLAEVTHLRGIVTCGYTATPPHPKLAKTARGCESLVPCRHHADSLTAVRELQVQGYCVVGLETVAEAPLVWDLEWRFPLVFLLGNEALGVANPALQACDQVARLPVFGHKNSLNVGNCAAVAVYQALRVWQARQTPNPVALEW
jgi:23S rRNA (guanosine2251-2'-O)-methyltransferase